jgi:hypothetical protein
MSQMGELQQVLGKLIAVAGSTEHWDGDFRKRMIEECADVAAAMQVFTVENFTLEEVKAMYTRSEEKKALFRKWHAEHTRPAPIPGPPLCERVSPMGNRCERMANHIGSCHANDEAWRTGDEQRVPESETSVRSRRVRRDRECSVDQRAAP